MTTDEISIVPLSEDRLADLRRLFDEGGDPKACQCAFWRVPASAWGDWTRERNRAALKPVAGREPAPGLIAYADGEAVGWVSVGPREDYVRLERSKVLKRLDDRPVWSIVCFVVSRRWRGRGVAAALLDAAIEHAHRNGATLLEAYPVDPSRGRVSAAAAYMGPLGMFERAGFTVAARQQWNAKSPVRPIVRLDLGRSSDRR
jgi:GNAT superfamily N-acetyltransferase